MATVRVRRQGLPRRRARRTSRSASCRSPRPPASTSSRRPTAPRCSAPSTALRSDGETALYAGVQDAVEALGTEGERSIVLLSDGGDTVAEPRRAATAARRPSARRPSTALTKAQGARRGRRVQEPGGQRRRAPAVRQGRRRLRGDGRRPRGGREGLRRRGPARSQSQVAISVAPARGPHRRPGASSSRAPRRAQHVRRPGRTSTSGASTDRRGGDRRRVGRAASRAGAPAAATPRCDDGPRWLPAARVARPVPRGLRPRHGDRFAPVFRSPRKERVGHDRGLRPGHRPRPQARAARRARARSASARRHGRAGHGGPGVDHRTMALLDRADLPWRAGEWFVLRVARVSSSAGSGLRPAVLATPVGGAGPRRRRRLRPARRAPAVPRQAPGPASSSSCSPTCSCSSATSLASGFSLLQALDAVARDAPEPCAKEFSRALAETRIGADVVRRPRPHGRADGQREHAVGDDGDPHPARGRRQPGRDAAHHGRDAARARGAAPARARRSRRRAGSRPTSSSRCRSACSSTRCRPTTTTSACSGPRCRVSSCASAGLVAMVIGIFWMRNVVKIEV